MGTVSAKLMHKLSVQAPPKITVEKYLIEIAKYYNVDYEPDPQIMSQDEVYSAGIGFYKIKCHWCKDSYVFR